MATQLFLPISPAVARNVLITLILLKFEREMFISTQLITIPQKCFKLIPYYGIVFKSILDTEDTCQDAPQAYLRPKKKFFVSCNGLKKIRVCRSVIFFGGIIFLVKNVCFMHVLDGLGVGRAEKYLG